VYCERSQTSKDLAFKGQYTCLYTFKTHAYNYRLANVTYPKYICNGGLQAAFIRVLLMPRIVVNRVVHGIKAQYYLPRTRCIKGLKVDCKCNNIPIHELQMCSPNETTVATSSHMLYLNVLSQSKCTHCSGPAVLAKSRHSCLQCCDKPSSQGNYNK
jgi:hypothetical protein